MDRYICIHGHFYQPPRENPWLEAIELQDSAYPYHDWNERISHECYSRNAAARILGGDKKIVDIVNNYSKISFNFGPTLLSWMETHDTQAYQAILEADRLSQKNFSGHGAAIAQVYNHMIMPLANAQDKRTQIIWGIKDFEYRFKRRPEGMWLAETAVDLESLDIMAEHGIKFTVLAPHQAKRVKKFSDKKWIDVSGQKIDPKRPYLCRLPSGRSISLFFYDGPISQAVAFERLLKDGAFFAKRLVDAFDPKLKDAQMIHIATDGETYGHHHKFADMALAYCLRHIESNELATVTIYGEYLEKFPPNEEVEILENTSWSCSHGVERWRSDCGCKIGINPKWNQKWRKPLRQSLDWLSEQANKTYEKEMPLYAKDIWAVRDCYIDVVLNRNTETIERFFKENHLSQVPEANKIKFLKLLEMQRNSMLMYTSCGWFFDEISGIEPTQILKYAARVIQLIEFIDGTNFDQKFSEQLKKAKSNVPEYKDGEYIYRTAVKPSAVGLLRVGAHYAVSSLFEEYPQENRIYCYTVRTETYRKQEKDRLKLSIGKGWVRSDITLDKTPVFFVGMHLGNHNIIRGVDQMKEGTYEQAEKEILEAFVAKRIPETTRLIERYFGPQNYSIQDLFRNEQQKILNEVLKTTMEEIEGSFRQIYDKHYPLMQVQKELHVTLPKALSTVVEFVLNRDLCDEIEKHPLDMKQIRLLIWELKRWSFSRDKETICFATEKRIDHLMGALRENPEDVILMETVAALLENLDYLGFSLDLWRAQNICFELKKQFFNERKAKSEQGDSRCQRWVAAFGLLADFLRVGIGEK
ncbi:MAG: DUF3536 domain-containing protein [Candidatus Aceula meridiana]|nr:DUF3536 domain-containing protein [Candidatus Aceula meridiana]